MVTLFLKVDEFCRTRNGEIVQILFRFDTDDICHTDGYPFGGDNGVACTVTGCCGIDNHDTDLI